MTNITNPTKIVTGVTVCLTQMSGRQSPSTAVRRSFPPPSSSQV
jgi:hypothetical protein